MKFPFSNRESVIKAQIPGSSQEGVKIPQLAEVASITYNDVGLEFINSVICFQSTPVNLS